MHGDSVGFSAKWVDVLMILLCFAGHGRGFAEAFGFFLVRAGFSLWLMVYMASVNAFRRSMWML